ncbi:hypothetical protein A2382_04465 [Candidatus Woesebacteria bacterium RIFOXYB1_FULL_38_16]|uniref:Uncharacterized protein n=1 Tax=Candidatus Woesebacteria bacterium RIFOXYB1_FULL_38_16 TaxID=1802538 RepID=A0A1F8CU64_9BACT|nr:MAG: hypothetical protein A2191_01005 [Candidatus Woesebacteria bacterium RIFOXYA1_FULL_38_9]OGM79822.1 MAG: hypothetical protein A2382_04465 [Candidatus Woesebacteria bacterium RIFOXYB1_FULL_38_16]
MDNLAQIDFNALENAAAPNFASGTIGDLFSGSSTAYNIVFLIFFFAGTLLLFYLIYGGFIIMTSRADPKKQQQAKGIITDAMTGFIIVFLAFFLVQLAGILLKLPGITNIFG